MIRMRAVMLAVLSTVVLFSAVRSSQAQVLRFDVDDRAALDPVNTEPGFEQFVIDGMENDDQATTTRMFGGVEVTIAHSNTAGGILYGDRRRDEPTNSGLFTEQELLRDFIFARGTTPDDGLDITIANLTPDSAYNVRIWSYDTLSNDARISDWIANGVLVMDDYTFDGNDVPPDPVDNGVYAFDFSTISDASGTVLVEGRWQGGPCCGVFLNALSLELDEDILVGDFTGDGVVDDNDFNRMAANMFAHLDGITGHDNGDFNLDGLIDLTDFHEFIEAFPAAAAAAQAVPEPSSLALGIMAILGLVVIGRRKLRG